MNLTAVALKQVMRRRLKIRTRILLLIALAVVVAAQGLSLLLNLQRMDSEPGNPTEFDFLLEVFGEPGSVVYPKGVKPDLPIFDPRAGSFTLDNQPFSEFASRVEGLEVGPHGSSPFVVIALPENATVGDYQKALVALTSHGICRVGVYAPLSNREFIGFRSDSGPSDDTFVAVYRVLIVKSDTSVVRNCIERFPAWAPWALQRE
ncbi:hypothetical protein A6F65_00025 [Paraurantiacibacter namhicola]|uniref:Uncharacterized protein n=1 Tax=Paraurantiacibacter namhicola TaxID=645517 RepID=A0A1C7D4X4_9SPHN|nr:hypothetical protein A6F65_00025 [Paraurantiacibacter namhicola]